jgi:RNA polymerase-binding protein DksA
LKVRANVNRAVAFRTGITVNKQQQRSYRPRLAELRKRLIEVVASAEQALRDDILSPGDHSASRMHPGDQDVEGLDEQLAIAQNEEQLLEQVEEALQRIEDGTFGKCGDCGRDISQARLEAIPYSARCIQCAQRDERASGD